MNKRVCKINKKKIKTRRTWNRNPTEQIVPNKQRENTDNWQKEAQEDIDDFERGFHD